jgi:hypothetical protein
MSNSLCGRSGRGATFRQCWRKRGCALPLRSRSKSPPGVRNVHSALQSEPMVLERNRSSQPRGGQQQQRHSHPLVSTRAHRRFRLSRMVSLGLEKSQGRITLIALVERGEVRSGPRNHSALFSQNCIDLPAPSGRVIDTWTRGHLGHSRRVARAAANCNENQNEGLPHRLLLVRAFFFVIPGSPYLLSLGSLIKPVKRLLTTCLWSAQGRAGGCGKNE